MCKTIKYMILENILNSVSNNMTSLIKSVARSTTREHVEQKYVLASPLKRILWNKDSDSGSTGFVFESICAKLVLNDF